MCRSSLTTKDVLIIPFLITHSIKTYYLLHIPALWFQLLRNFGHSTFFVSLCFSQVLQQPVRFLSDTWPQFPAVLHVYMDHGSLFHTFSNFSGHRITSHLTSSMPPLSDNHPPLPSLSVVLPWLLNKIKFQHCGVCAFCLKKMVTRKVTITTANERHMVDQKRREKKKNSNKGIVTTTTI